MHRAWVVGLIAVLLVSPVAAGAQVFLGAGSPDESPCELRLDIGRTSTGAATLYKLQRANSLPSATAPFGMASLHQYEQGSSSPYLAATLPVSLGDTAVLRLSGSCTIPSTSDAYFNTTGTRRTWSADTLWATLEAVLAVPVYEGFDAVAGFRWDNWQTSYTNPRDATSTWYADTDTAAVTVNSYLPYVGLVSSFEGLSVGAIGLPFYLGDFQQDVSFNRGARRRARFFGRMGEGHFFEVFMQWTAPIASLVGDMDARMGVFCKANWTKAKSTVGAGLVRSSGENGDGDYDLEFHRNLVTIGLNATVKFSLPDFAGRL